MLQGIDVSDYQFPINWNSLPVDFVFIKATEGLHTQNVHLISQAQGASIRGIKTGYYHFAHTKNSPQDELLHFLGVVKTLPSPTLPLVLDIEANDGNLNPVGLTSWIQTFLQGIVVAGYKAILYSYGPFLKALPISNLGTYPLWLADYEGVEHVPTGFTAKIWQYTGTGKVNGINGNVDLNRAEDLNF